MVALYKGATPIIRRYKGTQLIFDATPSDKPKNETLSFAWSGTSATMQYKINGTTYTASTNPYSTTLSELGITDFTNANTMFNSKRAITAVTSIPDTSNVTNMSYMFRYLGVSELEVTKTMNTSACTNMDYMFAYCLNLTSLDLSSFDTSKVTYMNMMFYNDQKLDYLDLSGWDLRNVTSKSAMFGNGVKPSKVIMNGCDCDTILFIRQQIQNNGVDHTKVVQTDTVCPTYETSTKITYNINIPSDSCAYNKYIYPDIEIVTNITDEYGVSSVTSNWMEESDYTVKFGLQDGGASVEGDNETGKDRNIVGVVYYNGEYIGEYVFTQKAKPTDSGGSSNSLSCDFDKSAQITDLYFDMDNLPEEWGSWWVGFSYNPNQEGDCNDCDWTDSNLRICLFENRYEGIMGGEITNLEQVNGLYHLHLDEPLYFKCGEENSHLERYYLKPDKSAPCGDTISFTSDSSSQRITINEREYDFFNINDYTETDGRYVFNKSLSELTNGNINSCGEINSMRRMFLGCTRIISIDNLPCTSNVTNMSQMFQDCERLTSLDLSSFNVTNVNNMNDMFYNCRELTSLNLNGWKLNDMVDTNSMFSGCNNLRELYLLNPDETTYMKIQNALIQSGIDTQILITK